jgi:hypothetical protein
MDYSTLLPLLHVSHVLGSGSNGVVLQCELPAEHAETYPAVPTGVAIAVKVVSHFWSPGSLELLSCERDAYVHLPQHYSILRIFAEFMGEIPETMLKFLSPDMQQVRVEVLLQGVLPGFTRALSGICTRLHVDPILRHGMLR